MKSNRPMEQIPVPSGLLACLLLIPLCGQETCQKQAGIPHRGRWIMKRTAVTLLIISSLQFNATAIAPLPLPETSRTVLFLCSTEIPEQTFDEVTLKEICEYLVELSKRYDPSGVGIDFLISKELIESSDVMQKRAKFFSNSMINEIDNVCYQLGLEYSIDGRTVLFRKKIQQTSRANPCKPALLVLKHEKCPLSGAAHWGRWVTI